MVEILMESIICNYIIIYLPKCHLFQQNQENKVRGPCSGSAITYPLNAKGSGRKGGNKRRQRLFHPEKPFEGRDEENASKNPFAQILHNNNPFPEKPFEGRDEEMHLRTRSPKFGTTTIR